MSTTETPTADQDLAHEDAARQAQEAAEASGGEPLQAVDEPQEGVGRKPGDERDKGSSGETTRDGLFDPAQYDNPKLRLPKIDGEQVEKIAVAFSGRVLLNRKDPGDVALMRRMKLGQDVTLQVEAKVNGKKHAFTTDKEGDLDAIVLEHGLKVETVYMPEPEEL